MVKSKKSILKKMDHSSLKSHTSHVQKGYNDNKIVLGSKDEASKLGGIFLDGTYYLAYVTYRKADIEKSKDNLFSGLKPRIVYLNGKKMVTDSSKIKELSKRLVNKYGEDDLDKKIEDHFKSSVLVSGVVNSISDPYKKQIEIDKQNN